MPQEAILVHQKALGFAPYNQEVLFALAADYEETKRFDDALEMYKRILSRDSSNLTAIIRMRDLYQRLGQWEELYETQSKLVANPLTPSEMEIEHRKLVGLKYEFGRSLLEAGDLERAKKIFRGVIKLDKDFIPAYLGLGEVYLEENKASEAAELWEKAYKMTSATLLLHRLEDLYLRQGEPGKAIELYMKAVNWKPQDVRLKFFLGKLYYRLEMVDEAFDILSTVDWGDKEFPDVHKLLGNIYLRRGSLGLAASEFKKALGFKKQIIIPYTCSNCELRTRDWSGRCPNCGKWNTFGVNLEKTC
jgi:tetratricopeptide (TPR) repeat protein